MVKNHLKRLAMPKTWTTKEKKRVTFVARVNPGAHPMNEGMPLVVLFREMLNIAKTSREVKQILQHKTVLVDGKKIKDHKYNVGLMDVISLPDIKEHYRLVIGKNRRLVPLKLDEKESKSKICKIRGKGMYKGKTQLRLSDGRVLLLDKSTHKIADSVVISVPDQKITEHLKFEKNATVLLIGGKGIGKVGTIEDISDKTVKIKTTEKTIETHKRHCFVIGEKHAQLLLE